MSVSCIIAKQFDKAVSVITLHISDILILAYFESVISDTNLPNSNSGGKRFTEL
jgi:hypothetical protein